MLILKYELAREISMYTHYSIALLGSAVFVFYKHRFDIYRIAGRLLILFYVWLFSCMILNSCPLTIIENMVSNHYYGLDFVNVYSFRDTDVAKLLQFWDLKLFIFFTTLIVSTKYIVKWLIPHFPHIHS